MKCYVPMPVPRVAWHAAGHAARHAVLAASVAAGGTGSGLVEAACARPMADVHRALRAEAPGQEGNEFREQARAFFPEEAELRSYAPRPPLGTPVSQLLAAQAAGVPFMPGGQNAGLERATVPAPPSLLLLATGLVALLGFSRRCR